MGSIAIKILIAGRTYPLTVDEREEGNIRAAAKRIETDLHEFQQNYAVADKQDLLAMAALQIATQLIENQLNANNEKQVAELNILEQKIATYLEDNKY